MRELPALWVDIDHKPEIPDCFCPPSFIVDSGRGLHLWWLLDEPAEPNEAFVDLLRGLRRVFAGDPAVCDLARIMRLPGTINSKVDRECRVLHDTGRRYGIDDISEWLSWQRELIGEPGNPFLAAAERLGVRPPVDIAEMKPGNIHETQLRWSASMAASGHPEDEIVAALLEATKLAAGEDGRRWNWRKEETAIREMIRSATKKFAVVDLAARRKKNATTGADEPEAPPKPKTPAIVRVATLTREAWGRPLITSDGELWTYEGGIWHQFDSVWEHRLRVCIQGAVAHLRMDPTSKILGGAYRWLLEHPDLVREAVQWDAAGVVVGRNGSLQIAGGDIVAHSPEHYATRRVACVIDREAACPTWMRFLAEALPEGAAGTLGEWFGAALVRGKTREMSKGLIVYGPSRTGKTQITEVIRALLGGNTCGVRVRDLSERFGREPLITASGWIADDAVGLREEMDAEGYKVIVTGESTSVQRKNKPNIEICFDLPVLLTMNNYPRVQDDSDAVYNRTLVLPMTRQWSEEEAQPIARKVVAEELSGVLNWALEGWHRLQKRGRFAPPESMLAAGAEFQGQNNPIADFLTQCAEESPQTYVMRNDFARIFNSWLKLEIQPRSPWSGRAVALALSKCSRLKVVGDKVKSGRVWVGIRFTEPALDYEEKEFGQGQPSLSNLNHGLTPELYERYRKPAKKVLF